MCKLSLVLVLLATFTSCLLEEEASKDTALTSPRVKQMVLDLTSKKVRQIVDPCGFFEVAVSLYLQKGGDRNKILENPAWRVYTEKAIRYVKKVEETSFVPPARYRCGGGSGPPLPPGFIEAPNAGVSARIVCLGTVECARWKKME